MLDTRQSFFIVQWISIKHHSFIHHPNVSDGLFCGKKIVDQKLNSIILDFNITIPGLLVSHEDGMALSTNFLYNSGFRLFITSEIPPNFSYYLIPFAIIIGAGILIIISYVVFQMMMCIMERRKAQRHRLSKKDLKKVTLQKYEKGIFYETCAICLDDYIEGEKIRILPCNHGMYYS